MSGQDLFERILGSLHEAVLDDSLWPAASGLIDQACASKSNFVSFGDGVFRDDIEIFFARFCIRGQRREDMERWWFRDYHHRDERVPRFRQLPDGSLVHNRALYTDEELKTSAAFNEALPRVHCQDGLVARLDGPGGSRICWSVGDPVDEDGWSTANVEMIARHLPYIRQYVRVRQALVDSRALGSSVAGCLRTRAAG